MPTEAIKPTELSTKAVGAALLHQFARQRFLEAGLQESLIEEAELESPDIADLFVDIPLINSTDDNQDPLDTSVASSGANISHMANNVTQTGPLNSTVRHQPDTTIADDQFHSIVNSTGNQTTSTNNTTINRTTNSTIDTTTDTITTTTTIDSMTSNNTQDSNDDFTLNSTNQSDKLSSCSTIKAQVDRSNYTSIREQNQDTTLYHSVNATSSNPDSSISQQPTTSRSNRRVNLDQLLDSPLMVSYGKELRQIAEDFAKTRLRQDVKKRADNVPLENINKTSFLQLLSELFEGGITGEKIAVLFFFCTDVAMRAVVTMAQDNLVVRLLTWSFTFIIKTVCAKVEELGGWNQVLCKSLPKWLRENSVNCAYGTIFLALCLTYFLSHRNHTSIST